MSSARDPWLVASGLDKRFGGVHALRGVDLNIAAGEIRGLVGPNGAGKSTLSAILSGAVVPDAGTVHIDGELVRDLSPGHLLSRGIVMMPQRLTLVPDADLVDNINLGREAGFRAGRGRAAELERARDAAERAGLRVALQTRASDLTPVDQRLLMLARALVQSPRLLILDEPTAGLPREGAAIVQEVVRGLRESVAVLYVSHHLSEIAALCDSVTCVREGRVAGEVAGEEVTKDAVIDLILGEAPPSAPSPTRSARDVRGPAVVEFHSVSGNVLHEVDLGLRANEVVGVTGLLGSGVDELLGTLAGRCQPRAGELRMHGRSVRLTSPAHALRLGVGYLAEDRSRTSFQGLTIRENAALSSLRRWSARGGRLTRRREHRGVAPYLATLSVTADPERAMSTLSGGNQQRVLMARLLAAQLDVVVIAEPTVGVDIKAREELWSAVSAMATGRVVVVASSEPEELLAMCDRIVCLSRGRVTAVLEGTELSERSITHAIS